MGAVSRTSRLFIAALAFVASAWTLEGQSPSPPAKTLDALMTEARALLDRSNYRSALPILEQALAQADAAHDEVTRAKILRGLGIAKWGLGDYRGSMEIDQLALTSARARHAVDDERIALNGLGLSEYSLTRYDQALAYYNQALEVDRQDPSPGFEGLVYANIGLIYRYKGRYDEAVATFQKSLALRRQAGDAAGVAQTLNHLGIVSRAMGEFQKAIEYYEQSLAERRRVGDRQGEAQTLNNLGNVLSQLGEDPRALEAYNQSLQISKDIGYTAQIALASDNIGGVLYTLRRMDEAKARYQAAIEVYRQLGRRSQLTNTLTNLGALLVEVGDAEKGVAMLEESLSVARDIGEPESEVRALQELGEADLAASKPADALKRMEAALVITRSHTMPELEYNVLTVRGMAFHQQGKLDLALADYRAATTLATDMRSRLTTDVGKIGFLDEHADAFTELARTLLELKRPEEALEAAESGRARAIADLLGSRTAHVKPSNREAVRSLNNAVNAVKAAADAPATDPAEVQRGSDLQSALADIRSRDRELASVISVDSPAMPEIRKIAARLGATLVEYLIGEDGVCMWIVDPHGELNAAKSPVKATVLEGQVKTLRQRLEQRADGATTPAAAPSTESTNALLRTLYRELIEPIEQWLPRSADEPVIVIGHGVLSELPFAALSDRQGRPLLERHTLAFAPAISVFRYTTDKMSAQKDVRQLGALIVAAPLAPKDSGLPVLPSAHAEARAVAARFSAPGTRILEGASATEAAVRKQAGDFDVLHFATHGVVSPDRPLASSLVLAAGDGEDGYLRVDEVFGLDLHARLIVLSGCSTGLGRVTGDGVLGFARAFMYAGTPDVVVSQWDVTDRGAATLMTEFYGALANGLSPARALRRAQLAARSKNPAPARWAAFVVVGEP